MELEHLIRMANQIAQYYRSVPDHTEAVLSTATHLRRFWEPRMRATILAHLDATGGHGLEDLTLAALTEHRGMLEPRGS